MVNCYINSTAVTKTQPGALKPDSEAAAAISVGGTGHRPVPSGDPPLGTGQARGIFRASVFSASVRSLPSGQWPDGTGGSPVPPIPISEFGLKSTLAYLAGRAPRSAHA